MATGGIWNVFLPNSLLSDSPVFLVGHIDKNALSVYITDICSTFTSKKRAPIIGELITSRRPTRTTSSTRSSCSGHVWVTVTKADRNNVESQLYSSDETCPCRCVTVLFDPSELKSSFVFVEEDDGHTDTILSRLLRAYSPTALRGRRNSLINNRQSCIENVFLRFLRILTVIFTHVENFLTLITLKWFWSKICILAPSIMNNVSYKLNRFKRVQALIDSKHKSKVILFDTCGQQLLDTVLGVVVMCCVMCCGHADIIAASLMHWAEDTAHHLNDLLHWLMGAPAGLKLNAQLTQYMGQFFLYHVYLWSGYLSVLRPVLGWILWTAAGFGLLGLTTQLCLVQDILSMLTLHIYCFYVYAARLYSLQIYTLSSLWRLFRGKKWNVLRLRVDSAPYTIDQLCVGTLLFTVLLFLLPTSLLYYWVFTALRLLVLSFHGVLMAVTETLNMVPAATVLLRLLRARCVAGDLLFTVLHDADCHQSGNSVTLSMQVIQLPLPKLYRHAQTLLKTEQDDERQQKYSWTELLRRVVSGSLVYPWIDPINSDSKEKES